MSETKAGESQDRRSGERRKGAGGQVPPELERRKSNRRTSDGKQVPDA